MVNNLRKHILSNYATTKEIGLLAGITIGTISSESSSSDEFRMERNEPTMVTENIEISDPDEFVMSEPTGFTHAIEESDPDEFIVSGKTTYETNTIETSNPDEIRTGGSTLETRGMVTSDPDALYAGPTKQTFTVEASDEDEILLV